MNQSELTNYQLLLRAVEYLGEGFMLLGGKRLGRVVVHYFEASFFILELDLVVQLNPLEHQIKVLV